MGALRGLRALDIVDPVQVRVAPDGLVRTLSVAFFLRPRATVPKLVKTNPVMAYSIPVRNGAGARERGNED